MAENVPKKTGLKKKHVILDISKGFAQASECGRFDTRKEAKAILKKRDLSGLLGEAEFVIVKIWTTKKMDASRAAINQFGFKEEPNGG